MGDFNFSEFFKLFSFNWNDFWNTFIATLTGAFIATGFSMWLTRRERPRPMWRLDDVVGKFGLVHDNYAYAPARLVNIGNGDAHNVKVEVVGAASYGPPESKHLVKPGESVPASFCFDLTGAVEYGYGPGGIEEVEDNRKAVWPANAQVLVEWQQPPSLRKVRRQGLSIAPLPEGWDSEKYWPKDIP